MKHDHELPLLCSKSVISFVNTLAKPQEILYLLKWLHIMLSLLQFSYTLPPLPLVLQWAHLKHNHKLHNDSWAHMKCLFLFSTDAILIMNRGTMKEFDIDVWSLKNPLIGLETNRLEVAVCGKASLVHQLQRRWPLTQSMTRDWIPPGPSHLLIPSKQSRVV